MGVVFGVEVGVTPIELYVGVVGASLPHPQVAGGQRKWVEAVPTSSFVVGGQAGKCRRVGGPWGFVYQGGLETGWEWHCDA